MSILFNFIIGIWLYLCIEDILYNSINIFTWCLLNICIIIYNPLFITLLPIYYLLKKISYIGLGDWIIMLFSLYYSHNYLLFFLIITSFSIGFVHQNKSPLYPCILIGFLTTNNI